MLPSTGSDRPSNGCRRRVSVTAVTALTPLTPRGHAQIPVTSRVQHRRRGQHGVILIQAGHRLPQIDRHPAADARGDPQHPPLAVLTELTTDG